ncbi:MAG TPA: hypothetical protein VG937_00745 [Polyangiaceae bacterium]|nr:hypothetical protein [Polyangiaceae bacterium]
MLASANPYLRFGLDSDPVAWAALLVACATLLIAASPRALDRLHSVSVRTWLFTLTVGAGALSAGYLAYYLRGGPRIIDATYYFLEARALANGFLSFPVPEPLAAFHGRFLLSAAQPGHLGVLFPPGYPAALAVAFKLHAPLLLGPAIAAALVPATYSLGRALGAPPLAACVAAGLSVVSAALRYHTADTMSHGWAALLLTLALLAALGSSKRSALAAGLALGWLIATRPVTGLVATVALLVFLLLPQQRRERAPACAALLAAGLVPGLCLLLAHQAAVSGDPLASTQLAYYARADGPPGCFRYGFGAGIGCLFEHGDYVRARLPHGLGPLQALATTWRRVLVHALDIANAAPLALGVPLGAWFGRRERGVQLLCALVLGVVLAYAPFYFEGSFPGGGARFFAELLPLEHVLVARALSELRSARFAWPLALAGFALHTSGQHRALRDREGGRPMFEPAVLHAQNVTRGLVFVSTDHGFALGHVPGELSASTGLIIAREHHDALDELLWRNLGRPPAYRYRYPAGQADARPELTPWFPEEAARQPQRVEVESLWPPESVADGWVEPRYVGPACASAGRGLKLHPGGSPVEFALALPRVPNSHFLRLSSVDFPPRLELSWADQATGQQRIRVVWEATDSGCWRSQRVGPITNIGGARLWFKGGDGVLDALTFEPDRSEKGVDN